MCFLNLLYHKKLVCSPDVDKIDMKRTLEQAIRANGLETDIRNIVFHLLRAANKNDTKNPIQCVSNLFVVFLCFQQDSYLRN